MTATGAVSIRDVDMKALLATLLLAGACASSGTRIAEEAPVASILTVHNGRTEEETIYVVRDGNRGRRLGQVNGLSTTTFVLTEFDVPLASDVQFLATSFSGGPHGILSDPVILRRGASYDWKLSASTGQDVLSAGYRTR